MLTGVVAGSTLSAVAISAVGLDWTDATALLVAVAILMMTVGVLATCGPARRALHIQASEALRAETWSTRSRRAPDRRRRRSATAE